MKEVRIQMIAECDLMHIRILISVCVGMYVDHHDLAFPMDQVAKCPVHLTQLHTLTRQVRIALFT